MWVEKHRDCWRIRDRVDGLKIDLATGYATKTAAKDAMTLMRSEALRGDSLVPRGGDRTVDAFCAEWWGGIGPTYKRVRTRESVYGVMNRYITRLLGGVTLKELEENPSIVQRWVNDLSAGRTQAWSSPAAQKLAGNRKPRPLAPATVRNAHGLMHQIMDAAIGKRLIRANPCARTRLPDLESEEQYYLTPAEADRLLAALPSHWQPLVLFMLATGCRWSEALGVRLKNLDVLGRKVRFLKKWIEDEHGHFHEEDPKSKRGRRTASFTAAVAEALIPLAMLDDDRDRHIFLTPGGKDVRHKEFYVVWHAARDAAGLKELRVHDLRHTHVAWLIAANIPLSAISRRLGHKSIAVTDDKYGHLLEEVDERLVRALDEAMKVIDLGGIWGATAPDQPRQAPVTPGKNPAH